MISNTISFQMRDAYLSKLGSSLNSSEINKPGKVEQPTVSEGMTNSENEMKGSSSLNKAKPSPEAFLQIYRSRIAQDLSLIKEAIKNKMREYNLPPSTRISLEMTASGKIEIKGSSLNTTMALIELELNKNSELNRLLDNHRQDSFMIQYIQLVNNLQRTYGSGNLMVERLLEFAANG